MQNLNEDMKKLVARIETVIREVASDGDPHWTTCQRICDEFELWEESEADGPMMPTWLMYVVSGVGRDLGILN